MKVAGARNVVPLLFALHWLIMGTDELNPIVKHLIRTIDATKLKTQVLIAQGLAIALVTLIFVTAISSSIATLSPTAALIGIIPFAALMAVLPPAAGAVSASATHRTIHSDSFDLLWVTTIPAKDMATGFVEGIQAQLRPLYAATNSLIVSAGVWVVLAYFVLGGRIDFAFLVIVLLLNGFGWLAREFERAWVKVGILAGIYIPFRLRAMSIGGVSAITPSAIVVLQVFWPMLMLLMSMITQGVLGAIMILVFAAASIVMPFYTNGRLAEEIESHITRARLSPEKA